MKKYLLQSQVIYLHVPKCPQLNFSEFIKKILSIDKIIRYLPDLSMSLNTKAYIERGFLFVILNTFYRDFLSSTIAEIDNKKLNAGKD